MLIQGANPRGHAVYGLGLQPLVCWDCECCVLSDRSLCDEL